MGTNLLEVCIRVCELLGLRDYECRQYSQVLPELFTGHGTCGQTLVFMFLKCVLGDFSDPQAVMLIFCALMHCVVYRHLSR